MIRPRVGLVCDLGLDSGFGVLRQLATGKDGKQVATMQGMFEACSGIWGEESVPAWWVAMDWSDAIGGDSGIYRSTSVMRGSRIRRVGRAGAWSSSKWGHMTIQFRRASSVMQMSMFRQPSNRIHSSNPRTANRPGQWPN